jgi:hypothetical protein
MKKRNNKYLQNLFEIHNLPPLVKGGGPEDETSAAISSAIVAVIEDEIDTNYLTGILNKLIMPKFEYKLTEFSKNIDTFTKLWMSKLSLSKNVETQTDKDNKVIEKDDKAKEIKCSEKEIQISDHLYDIRIKNDITIIDPKKSKENSAAPPDAPSVVAAAPTSLKSATLTATLTASPPSSANETSAVVAAATAVVASSV